MANVIKGGNECHGVGGGRGGSQRCGKFLVEGRQAGIKNLSIMADLVHQNHVGLCYLGNVKRRGSFPLCAFASKYNCSLHPHGVNGGRALRCIDATH